MFNGVQGEKFTGLAAAYVTELGKETMESYRAIYSCNRHRVYALAFWMTDNELAAEQLMEQAFIRAFSISSLPTEEIIDCALLETIRQLRADWRAYSASRYLHRSALGAPQCEAGRP